MKTFRPFGLPVVILALFSCGSSEAPIPPEAAAPAQSAPVPPGERVLLDAHNCYPYEGRWADRIDRALALGPPLAIEQDLRWFEDPATGEGVALVAHDPPVTGEEPSLRNYFFDRIRPLMEAELESGDRSRWPAVILNLDFKTEEDAHLTDVWELLGDYESWLTTAPKGPGVTPMTAGPLLVLTGDSDKQQKVFYDAVPEGGTLRLFGAVRAKAPSREGVTRESYLAAAVAMTPEQVAPEGASTYRRWWNNPWLYTEEGGQPNAGDWTDADAARLAAMVDHAHAQGLWIRFYTLNGHDPADESGGWSTGYNFGSLQAVRQRWLAAIRAGVDFVATDQYERFHETLEQAP